MAITVQGRIATPGVGLTGGSRSTGGSVGPGLQKLANWFKRDKSGEGPRVKGGEQPGERHRLKLARNTGTIDLARLFKGETTRVKQERRDGPLPKDSATGALRTLAGATAYKRDTLTRDATELGHLLDSFNAGQDPVRTTKGTPVTLAELKDELDTYAVWLRDELGGESDALDAHVDKAVAEIGDISQRIAEKLGLDKAPTRPGNASPQVTPPQSQAPQSPPPKTLAEKVDDLTAVRDKVRDTLLDPIAELHRAIAEKPGRKAGKWADRQVELTGAKMKAHAEIDKALAGINTLLTQHASDPTKAGEVAALKTLRTELTRFAVQVEFPDLPGAMPRTLPRQEVVTAIRGIGHIPAHGGLDVARLRTVMDGHADYIGEVIDGFNAGHDPVVLQDGTSIGLAAFRDEIDTYARKLSDRVKPEHPVEFRSAVDAALAKLSELSKQMGIRIGLDETVAALEHYQSVPQNTLTDPQKLQQKTALDQITPQDLQAAGLTAQDVDPKGRTGSTPPPLGALLRAIRSAMPHIDIDGTHATSAQKRNASEALGTLCQLVVEGNPPDMLLGHGASLDATLLAFRQEHAVGTTPALTKAELIDAGKRRKAASLRQELNVANAQLDRLLKLKGGTRVFGQGAASIRKDTAFIEALHNLGGRKAGREVAFLIARISDLEVKTFALEQEALGLHDGLDLTTFKPIDPSHVPDPNARKPGLLEHAGITDRDLDRMGLTGKDREEVGKLVVDLNRKGMGSVREVEDTSRAIDRGIRQVLRNEVAQDSMLRFGQDTPGALGRTLLHEMLVNAKIAETGRVPDEATLSIKDPDVTKAFTTQGSGIETAVKTGDPTAWQKLADGARDHRDAQLGMVKLLGAFADIDSVADGHRARLGRLGGPTNKGGLDLDLDTRKPQGLESARAILEALDADAALRTDPGNRDLIARRDGALDRLKGFDATRMHRPWHQKLSAAFGRADRPDIATLGRLREAAESIVYLRDTAPREKAALNDRIVVQAVLMDDILADRARAHPQEMETARQLIRTAILDSWPPGVRDVTLSKGHASDGYDPASKRDTIVAQLKQWGLDTDRFGPEIDKEMYGTLTVADMRRWSGEATLSPAIRDRPTTFRGVFFGTESITARRDLDAPTKRALLTSLETMADGGKLSLKAGHRITLDTGKIPLEPTGLNTLKAKLAGASVGHMEVERGSDGYRLHLRSGGEGKIGVDYGLGYKIAEFAKAEIAGAGAEVSASYTSGVTITFKADDKGREALLGLITKMIDDKPIGVSDWSSAIDVATSSEATGKGSLTGRVGVRAELMYGIEGGTKHDKLGIGVNTELSGTAGIGGKSTDIDSLREHTHKGEVEISAGITLSAQVYARIGNPLNIAGSEASKASGLTGSADKNYDLSSFQNTDLASGSIGVNAVYTRKWKQVTDDQGFYTKGEIVNQTNVRLDSVIAFFTVSDATMVERMDAHPEFAENLRTLIGMTRLDDVVAVTYALKPEAMLHANTLIDQAKSLRREGETDRARELEARARTIAEDPANHAPSKISIVSTKIDKNEVTNLNARWIRWDVYSDGKLEHPSLSLNVPG